MTPERWRQLETIYQEAMAQPAADRAAFVAGACAGDAALQAEVQELLATPATADGLLGASPAALLASASSPRVTLVGRRIGAYEIQALVGAGGMGEVYRARDTRLRRDVAVKILPQALAEDPDRLARFEREARLLASLNHPHIAIIHGIEDFGLTPDAPSVTGRAIVMELVAGETLAQRLARGPLALAEALPVAVQICEALEAAHERGIIHRDLKPANITLTQDGTVKVLDFGLAKLAPAPADGDGVFDAGVPTVMADATHDGLVVGTAAYMSPEQARGQAVDKRTDIWAFGCVLYEMLTGSTAFARPTITDTLAAIVEREPDWTALPATTPPHIRQLLRRCLQKDARRRLRDIGDARMELDGALTPASVQADLLPDRAWRRLVPWAAVAAAAAIAVGAVGWRVVNPPSVAVVRTLIATPEAAALRVGGGGGVELALTPDGSRVIYRGDGQLLVRRLDQLAPVALPGLGNPGQPFVSPDGQWVGFFDGGALKRVAITGGPAQTLVRADATAPSGASWAPDGHTIIFATGGREGLRRVAAGGGEASSITTVQRDKGEVDHAFPQYLPSGDGVLFTVLSREANSAGVAHVAILNLATGSYEVLLRGQGAQYLPSGHLVYSLENSIWAVGFDARTLEVRGSPMLVVPDVPTLTQRFSVAANGTLVYVPQPVSEPQATLAWVDRAGREEPLAVPPRPYSFPRVSPDGTRIALDIRDESNDVWIWDIQRRTLTRLTSDPSIDGAPIWSTDSRTVIFSSRRDGVTNLYSQGADGTGIVARLGRSERQQMPLTVAPDGDSVIFRGRQPGGDEDLMLLSLRSPTTPQPLVKTPFLALNADVSPDGRWLAYDSFESGRQEVYVRPFPNVNAGRWQVSTDGGRFPVWSRAGHELFYLSANDVLMGARVQPGRSWMASTSSPAFPPGSNVKFVTTTRPASPARYLFAGPNGSGRPFDIAPDGRFLTIKDPGFAESSRENIIVVQNWQEELKRLVPAN